ncbi:MAG: tetratricopeptide repeat protein [Thermoanaerobaculia bacterium]
MRVRSFIGLLLAIAGGVYAVVLHTNNRELFEQRFHLGPETSIPLWGALLAIFLAGFLPTAITLVVDTLRSDLGQRRRRRRQREEESLEGMLRRAVDFQADGQWGKAAGELENYLAGKPDHFTGQLRYGEVLRHLGRTEEAIEVHRRAAAAYPRSVSLLYHLAADHRERGDDEVAREIEARILRDFPGFGLEVLRDRRAGALSRRDFDVAGGFHSRITELLNESGDSAALARESSLAQGLAYQQGVRLLEDDRASEAGSLFRGLLAHEPRFIPARIMLGEAELLEDREAEAIAAWREGYQETGSPVFLQRIEDYFIEQEEPIRAIETLRALIAAADNDLLPRFYLGRLYYRLEMLDEATKQLGAIEERIRSSPTYHFLLGRIHHRRGDLPKAVESFGACLRQLDIGSAEFVCRVCHERYGDWRDSCSRCGSWNSIDLNFEEERISAEELGVREVPVWGPTEDSGEFSLTAIAAISGMTAALPPAAASPTARPEK